MMVNQNKDYVSQMIWLRSWVGMWRWTKGSHPTSEFEDEIVYSIVDSIKKEVVKLKIGAQQAIEKSTTQ